MVDVVGDLNARLSRVFIGELPEEKGGKIIPRYVDSFYRGDAKGRPVMARFYNRPTESYKDVVWDAKKYLVDCPKVGMCSDGEKVYYITRTPHRQWKGGFTSNVLHLEPLSHMEFREIGLPKKEVTHEIMVDFAYNPEYTKLEDGLESMKKGKIFSFPLSRKFAIGQKIKAKYPVVFYKSWVIGWVRDGVIDLPKSSSHLFEELSQYAACRRV